jgi:hypothetical protein
MVAGSAGPEPSQARVATRPRSFAVWGIPGLVLALVLGAGAAYGFLSGGGSGSGSGVTGTMQPVAVTAFTGGDAPASTLIPGGTADVILRLHNPNPVPVRVFSVVASGPVAADISHPGCTTTGVTFDPPDDPITPTITVGPGASVLVELAGAASMDATSSPACQGASFHIPVTLTAHR